MALIDTANVLTPAMDGSSGDKDDLDFLLRNRMVRVNTNITEAEQVTIMVAEKACTLVAANFLTEAGATSSATNYLTLTLDKDDGAGGSETTFDTKGGASTAITAGQTAAFTIVEKTDTLAAGDRLFIDVSAAGSGDDWGMCLIEVQYRYD